MIDSSLRSPPPHQSTEGEFEDEPAGQSADNLTSQFSLSSKEEQSRCGLE